jgi:hypothetical protein
VQAGWKSTICARRVCLDKPSSATFSINNKRGGPKTAPLPGVV